MKYFNRRQRMGKAKKLNAPAIEEYKRRKEEFKYIFDCEYV